MGQSYRELIAWQKAMDFVLQIYKATRAFPRDELFGLAIQLRRAAVAVPANIAQGQARFSAGEFHHFLGRARSALVEIETHIMIAQSLNYISTESGEILLSQASEIGRILNGLATAIRPAA